jgi:ketosteroid isomerase-like protein
MNSDHSLIRSLYDAFNERRLEAVLAFLHPDVDWPNGMDGGRVSGREQVRDYWTRQWNVIDPHVEPLGLETDGETGRIAVHLRQVVRDLDGRTLVDQFIRHVYAIDDGLVLSMERSPRLPPATEADRLPDASRPPR